MMSSVLLWGLRAPAEQALMQSTSGVALQNKSNNLYLPINDFTLLWRDCANAVVRYIHNTYNINRANITQYFSPEKILRYRIERCTASSSGGFRESYLQFCIYEVSVHTACCWFTSLNYSNTYLSCGYTIHLCWANHHLVHLSQSMSRKHKQTSSNGNCPKQLYHHLWESQHSLLLLILYLSILLFARKHRARKMQILSHVTHALFAEKTV